MYLDRKKDQGDAPATLANLTNYLTPWKDELMRTRARPTNQRIKAYLTEKGYNRNSYWKNGKAIVAFVNDFAEQNQGVALIPPCGPHKGKAILVMPQAVVAALTAHVMGWLCKFAPPKKKCTELEDQARLAKYLGKYHRSSRQEAVRPWRVLTQRPRPRLMLDMPPTKLVHVVWRVA